MAYIPNYILRVYNPEYYGSSQVVAMPMQLRANEYWELTGVEGASADFMGLDVQQGADASGSLFTYPTYEDRQIEFTLAIKKGHEADAETYLSRYLQPNVYATLYNADWGEDVFMQCVIAGWSLNRYSNNVTATITIQPMDRAWHQNNVAIDFVDDRYNPDIQKDFVMQTDLPAYPVITGTFRSSTTATGDVSTVNIQVIKYTRTPQYDGTMSTTSTSKDLTLNCPAGMAINEITQLSVDCVKRSIVLRTASTAKSLGNQVLDSNWDWGIASGDYAVRFYCTTATGSVLYASSFTGTANPRYAVCPRVITDPVDGFAFSPNLKSANIKSGVEILGVTGTYAGGSAETYTGKTTVTPSSEQQTLATANKMVLSDITINAIKPVLTPQNVEITETTKTAVEQVITVKDQEYTVAPEITQEGWYTTGQGEAKKYKIANAEREKITAENIKAGVNILGVDGTFTGGEYEAYTGDTTVTPSSEQQTLATSGKVVTADVVVKAVPEATENVEIVETTTDGEEQNLTTVSQQYKVAPRVPTEGWYKAGTAEANAKTYQIAPAEQAKLIADNIKKGVVILGVTGSYEGSGGTGGDNGIVVYLAKKNVYNFASRIVSIDVEKLGVLNLTDYQYLFCALDGLTEITNLNTLNNTQNVTSMRSMFNGCRGLTSLNLSSFNPQSVTDMASMFSGCSGLTALDIAHFVAPNVENIETMFYGCSGLTALVLPTFGDKITSIHMLFGDCTSLTNITGTLNTSGVTEMSGVFYKCFALTDIASLLASFDTASVKTFVGMFYGCSALTDLSLSNFNTASATDMSGMFCGCAGLTSLNLSPTTSTGIYAFNTRNVTSMADMFAGCSALHTLHIDSFNTNNVTSMAGMFAGCSSLATLNLGNNWGAGLQFYGSCDLSDCTSLSHASAVNILGKLAKTSNLLTITFAPAVKALLSDAEIKVATDKGWTVA